MAKRKGDPQHARLHVKAEVTWATLGSGGNIRRGSCCRDWAGFTLADVCVSALHDLDLCGHLEMN